LSNVGFIIIFATWRLGASYPEDVGNDMGFHGLKVTRFARAAILSFSRILG
jgi:hypothetical protein